MSFKPIIGLTADSKLIDPHVYHCVGEKYIRSVIEGAGGIPVLIPPVSREVDLLEVLSILDGVVLPGSYSNIEPHHYGGEAPDPDSLLDPDRDHVDLNLIDATVELGIPLFGICRGFQSINVARGGTIHQKVHQVAGLNDHRENPDDPIEVQYGPAHTVSIAPGGVLQALFDDPEPEVNSVHWQGVDRLGEGLRVEATAADGLVEAFSILGARTFALGVQWHPEWKPSDSPFYAAIWAAFAKACRERAAWRHRQNPLRASNY
ncbi:MAG: gamma-glutamyl-gamma-aminobutyrate hydrolase family protein [Xanthomonadales bacterium]|nr:gamma-glutamyl-gamma-aminobutyrate hydrolase family protein [Xanthomonadales bacterium]